MFDLWNAISPQVLLEIVLTSSVLILLLAAIRRLLGNRISGRLQYALWLLVALRLLIPGSLFPAPVTVTEASSGFTAQVDTLLEQPLSPGTWSPEPTPQTPDQETITPAPQEPVTAPVTDETQQTAPSSPSWGVILGWVWLGGAAITALVLAGTNLSFLHSLKRRRQPLAIKAGPLPVYLVPGLPSPCLAGIFRPAVYLNTAALEESRTAHILTHELVHYRHLDPLWGLVRCLCLSLYWFNPLVWLAAELSRRDSELACDEGVIRRLGEAERIPYGETLVAMVSPASRQSPLLHTATTMSGSGRQIGERVRRIVRKPKALALTALIVVVLTSAAVVLTFGGSSEPQRHQKAVDAETAQALSAAVDAKNMEAVFSLLPEISWGGYQEAAGTKAVQNLLDLLYADSRENMWNYDSSRYTAILGLGSAGLDGAPAEGYDGLICQLATGHPAQFGTAAGTLDEEIQQEIARCLGTLAEAMGGPTQTVSGSSYLEELTDWGMAWMAELRGEATLSLPEQYDDGIFSFPVPETWRDTVVLRRGTYEDMNPDIPLSYYVTCLSKEVWYAEGDGMGHICTLVLAPKDGEMNLWGDMPSSPHTSRTASDGTPYDLFIGYPSDVQFMTDDQAWLFRRDEAEAILKEMQVTMPLIADLSWTQRPDTVDPAVASALTAAVERKDSIEVLELLPQVSLKGYLQATDLDATQNLLSFLWSRLQPASSSYSDQWYYAILGLGFDGVKDQPLNSHTLLTSLAVSMPHLFGSVTSFLSQAEQEAISQELAPLADQAGADSEDRETWGLEWMKELRGETTLSLPEQYDDGIFSFPVPESWQDMVFFRRTTTDQQNPNGAMTYKIECYSKESWYTYGTGMGHICTFFLTPAGSEWDISAHAYSATPSLSLADANGFPYNLFAAYSTDVQFTEEDQDLFREELSQEILKAMEVDIPEVKDPHIHRSSEMEESQGQFYADAVVYQDITLLHTSLSKMRWGDYRRFFGEEELQNLLDLITSDYEKNGKSYGPDRYLAILAPGSDGLTGKFLTQYQSLVAAMAKQDPSLFRSIASLLDGAVQEELNGCL